MTPQRLNEIRRFYDALVSRFDGVDAPLVGVERDAVLTLMGELLDYAEATT